MLDGINKWKPTEQALKINRASKAVIMKKGTCMLLQAAIAGDRMELKKVAEKILKYKYHSVEIQRIWNAKQK
jgi:hypothetical protein